MFYLCLTQHFAPSLYHKMPPKKPSGASLAPGTPRKKAVAAESLAIASSSSKKRGKKRAREDEESDGDTSPTDTKATKKAKGKKKKQRAEGANLTDETAGLGSQEKYNQNLPKLEADREKRKHDLLAKKLFTPQYASYGVHVVDHKVSDASGAKLAGYMNCTCASQLGELWNKCKDDVIEPFMELEKVCSISNLKANCQLAIRIHIISKETEPPIGISVFFFS